MPDKLSEEDQQAIDELSEAVAKELAEGKSEKDIAKELVKQGWSEELSTTFVGNIKLAIEQYKASPEGHQIMASKYKRHMFYGFLWAAGGTVVTIATLNAASGGGFYIVAWGAILFGIIDFLRGLFGWLKYRY